MPSTISLFDRELKLATADLEPAAINAALARFAKSSVAEVVRSGQASEHYDRFVNGRLGAPEESVQAPGPIVYEFVNWAVIIGGALEELRRRAPRRSGRYAESFIVIAGGRVITDFSAISGGSEVAILNRQPYSRKIETGANKSGARHFDLAKAAFNRRFSGAFVAQMLFLNVGAGVAPGVPYILKGSQGRRKDRQSGQPITYPALVINVV